MWPTIEPPDPSDPADLPARIRRPDSYGELSVGFFGGGGGPRDKRAASVGGAEISVDGLTWRPARRRTPVLTDLDLSIPAGQRVLLAGPSGSGKSTLLRALAGLLRTADQGDLSGSVKIAGRDVAEGPRRVSLLLQDPAAGVVAETVGRDVAFGLENQRVPQDLIWPRTAAALRAARFPYGVDHLTSALSGGETQGLLLAGMLVLDTPVLLLDEPTSMLDPKAAGRLRQALRLDVQTRGCTTVVVEQHLEPWVDFVDRLIVLGDGGRVIADGPVQNVLAQQSAGLAARGVWVPGLPSPTLLSVDEELVGPSEQGPADLLRARDLVVKLRASLSGARRALSVALDGVDVDLHSGRALAITGDSGAGKSTLVAALAGLLRPTDGYVRSSPRISPGREDNPWRWRSRDLAARLSWVPQSSEHGITARSVLDEVLASARACGRPPDQAHRRARGLLEAFGLSRLEAVNPYHLSGGEQRRLMVAAALAHGPYGVLLDEPTVGQDRHTWAAVVGAVAAARTAGCGVAVSTHDSATVTAVADDTLRLNGGRIAG